MKEICFQLVDMSLVTFYRQAYKQTHRQSDSYIPLHELLPEEGGEFNWSINPRFELERQFLSTKIFHFFKALIKIYDENVGIG